MKQKILFVLAFIMLLPTQHYAQKGMQGKATYNRMLSYFGEDIQQTDFEFIFNSHQSLFTEKDTTAHSDAIQSNSEDEYELTFNVNLKSAIPYAVYTNLVENKIRSRQSLRKDGVNQSVIVEESICKINWTIADQFKKIGTLNCQKAEGSFRGRKYVAWFAAEIPVALGPWKFNGLPGLIAEIYDDKKEVYFGLKSIDLSSNISTEIPSLSKTDMPVMSLKEYIQEASKQADDILNSINAKLPRGAVFTINKVSVHEIETEYEFDKE